MLPMIFAQLVTLSVGDRTEARYIVAPDDKHYEASTRPVVALDTRWRHSSLTLSYGPTITVVPLESEPRQVFVFHGASLVLQRNFRYSSIALSETLGYG